MPGWRKPNAWQCKHGFYVYNAPRARFVGCLSDYALFNGFVAQGSDGMQMFGCGVRESSRGGVDYDGITVTGSSGDPVSGVTIVGCKSMNDSTVSSGIEPGNQRYGIYLAYVSGAILAGNDCTSLSGNLTGPLGLGAGVTGLRQFDADGLAFSATSASATAGSSGAAPAQVAGYVNATVGGTAVRIPYYLS